jgi:hypothetical protein
MPENPTLFLQSHNDLSKGDNIIFTVGMLAIFLYCFEFFLNSFDVVLEGCNIISLSFLYDFFYMVIEIVEILLQLSICILNYAHVVLRLITLQIL